MGNGKNIQNGALFLVDMTAKKFAHHLDSADNSATIYSMP